MLESGTRCLESNLGKGASMFAPFFVGTNLHCHQIGHDVSHRLKKNREGLGGTTESDEFEFVCPREDLDVCGSEGLRPVEDEDAGMMLPVRRGDRAELFDTSGEIRGEGSGRLDLDRNRAGAGGDDQVDLVSFGITIE